MPKKRNALNGSQPKIVFSDGEVGYVIQPGAEQSLIYFPDDEREQYYSNKSFQPVALKLRRTKPEPIKPRRVRRALNPA